MRSSCRLRARHGVASGLCGAVLLWSLAPQAIAAARRDSNVSACAALANANIAEHTAVVSAREVPGGKAALPSYCEINAIIRPVTDSRIGVVYRLPERWNGKLVGLGGGGWAGNVTLREAAPALAQGYATAQTDAGHAATTIWDTSWAANPQSQIDFSYRAIHLMTTVGKAVVAKYYGRRQSQAYFQGCSTGGRQALMEAQRFPDDYEGIVAGAPVYDLLTQTTGLLRNQAFVAPGAQLSAAQLDHLNRAALAACDAADGLKGGIITDPRKCGFDPIVLECKRSNPLPNCLSPIQVAAVREVYAGVKTSDGRIAAYPLARGSEAGWSRFLFVEHSPATQTVNNPGGMNGLRRALFGDPNYDLAAFNPERDLSRMRTSAFARMYQADNPDIAPFLDRGGKLLMWHGFYDPGPSPLGTIDYYERVRRTTGAKVKHVGASVRLFILPGVYHCGGGPGADRFDSLSAIDRWVTRERPPEHLIATRRDGKLSRPLCAYPKLPYYRGHGNPDDARSFMCR